MVRGNIRQRSKVRQDSWTVQVYLGRDPTTGNKKYHSESVKGTKSVTQKRLTELLRELDTGSFIAPTGLTVGEYLDEWFAGDADQKTRIRTLNGYRGVVRRYLKPALGGVQLEKLTAKDVRGMESMLLRRGSIDGRPLSAKTVVQAHRVLSSALNAAVTAEIVSNNVARSVTPPKVKRYEPMTLKWEDIHALLQAIDEDDLKTLVVVAMQTGLRRSEIVGLQWRDLDLDRGTLSVRRSLTKVAGREAELDLPKSGRGRVVTLPAAGVQELKCHLGRVLYSRPEDFVFTGADGRFVNPDWLSKWFKLCREKAGLQGLRFHDLRHTHASLMLADGVHLKVVSERLGHSSIGITADLYSHVAPTVQRDAADRFEASWQSVMVDEGSRAFQGNRKVILTWEWQTEWQIKCRERDSNPHILSDSGF